MCGKRVIHVCGDCDVKNKDVERKLIVKIIMQKIIPILNFEFKPPQRDLVDFTLMHKGEILLSDALTKGAHSPLL